MPQGSLSVAAAHIHPAQDVLPFPEHGVVSVAQISRQGHDGEIEILGVMFSGGGGLEEAREIGACAEPPAAYGRQGVDSDNPRGAHFERGPDGQFFKQAAIEVPIAANPDAGQE